MRSTDEKKRNWKETITHEFVAYWVEVIYLSLVFSTFTQYRRFLLAAYGVTYAEYGVSVIKAMVFAKIIAIGGVFRFGRALEQQPLIFPTLYKAVYFSFLAGVFIVIEAAVKNLWNGRGLMGGLEGFFQKDLNELLAGMLAFFVTLIPFFAFKELTRVLGDRVNLAALFLHRRADQ